MKRILELTAALIFLILFSPLLCLISLCIVLENPGTVIFKQERIGFLGKVFIIYKFRTMFCDTDPLAISPNESDDPRITRIGKFLRKFGLDELPQLFNILKGDMSFVGPRPQLQQELEKYLKNYPELLKKRTLVRPGLTSSWIIIPSNIKHIPSYKMLLTDCNYVDNCSLFLDIFIIINTIRCLSIKY
jgi:lipopolysaccharide/colanic/teichoic acid biosynthesis glycosyltransferase